MIHMRELSPEEIDSILEETGYGFLGLARDDRPYVIPMSFGYDGDDCFFQMNSQGRKFDYIENGAPAVLNALHVDRETGVSKSVLVEGCLREIPETQTETVYQTLASNASFGTDLSAWGVPLQDSDLSLYTLRSDEISGLGFGEKQAAAFEE
jgi:hypothetical protein